MGYMGYHSKTFTFSNSCTFWMDGGEEIGFYQITKDDFVTVVNRHDGLDLSFNVKNDVIVEAWLSS